MLTNPGPKSGVRALFPSSPAGASTKQPVSKNLSTAGLLSRPLHTRLGRLKLLPLFEKFTPELSVLVIRKRGKPEMACSITSTSQFPRMAFIVPPQLVPHFLLLPNGRS